jgi:hypothetical protein
VSAFDVILLSLAALVAAYLLLMIVLSAMRSLRRAGAQMRDTFTAPFSTKFDEFDRESRLRRLEEEMRRALGLTDTWGSQERADIVEAAVAAQQITVLNQHLRKSVGQCLQTHWAVAQGLGTTDMGEAARHPWCNSLRQRVVDLSDLLSQRLEQYPLILDAPELIRLQLGIRWIAPTCMTCPYRTGTVKDAPRICPTAKAMGHRPSPGTRTDTVVDAEVVCEEERQ